MKDKPYSVQGEAKGGYRIAIPTETGVKKGDRYDFVHWTKMATFVLLPGSLVYVPHVDDNAGTGGSDKKKVKK